MLPTLPDAECVLRRWFGYSSLRTPQRRAISAVLRARDTLVVMPTGGGKSLCFQVPALMLNGLTVVLSPLVSLMKDQVDTLVAKGIPATGLHGGMSGGEQAEALVRVIRGSVKMLYLAPERLLAGRTIDALRRVSTSLLAIDEAHCISEWGNDFRPAYRQMQDIRGPLGNPPVIALTATATPDVRDDIRQVCGLRDPVQIVAGFDRPNLRYAVQRVSNARERNRRLSELLARRTGPAVVYAQTRSRVERIASTLRTSGVAAVPYHAGQLRDARRAAQERFMRGDVDVIVATCAFGMGVDKPNVRLVVHDAISASLESYYQEAGRAGRDGAPSDCVLLYARADRRSPEYFIRASSPSAELVAAVHAAAVRQVRGSRGGTGPIDPAGVARTVKSTPAEVSGALTILSRAGAIIDRRGDGDRVWVRLTGTPGRIAGQLARDSHERHLLGALWSVTCGAVRSGCDVPLAALPPGLGSVGLVNALDALMKANLIVWERPQAGLFLSAGPASLAAPAIDWAAIDTRRIVARQRLAAMVRYAESRVCRRRVLLGYFGDHSGSARCDACDRCQV